MKTYYNHPIQQLQFENKDLNKNEVLEYLQGLSLHKDSFLGVIDVYDEVLVFYPKSEDRWLIDHLVVPNTLHRQRYATTNHCIEIITKLFEEQDIETFKDFEEVPVQEFTLDEIVQFKKEEQILLKNEEEGLVDVIETKSSQENNKPKPDVAKKKPKRSFLIGDIITSKNEGSAIKNKKSNTSPSKKDDSSFFSI